MAALCMRCVTSSSLTRNASWLLAFTCSSWVSSLAYRSFSWFSSMRSALLAASNWACLFCAASSFVCWISRARIAATAEVLL